MARSNELAAASPFPLIQKHTCSGHEAIICTQHQRSQPRRAVGVVPAAAGPSKSHVKHTSSGGDSITSGSCGWGGAVAVAVRVAAVVAGTLAGRADACTYVHSRLPSPQPGSRVLAQLIIFGLSCARRTLSRPGRAHRRRSLRWRGAPQVVPRSAAVRPNRPLPLPLSPLRLALRGAGAGVQVGSTKGLAWLLAWVPPAAQQLAAQQGGSGSASSQAAGTTSLGGAPCCRAAAHIGLLHLGVAAARAANAPGAAPPTGPARRRQVPTRRQHRRGGERHGQPTVGSSPVRKRSAASHSFQILALLGSHGAPPLPPWTAGRRDKPEGAERTAGSWRRTAGGGTAAATQAARAPASHRHATT